MTSVVDLCTPPPSPLRDTPEDESGSAAALIATAAASLAGNDKRTVPEEDSDDDVYVVTNPLKKMRSAGEPSGSNPRDDDEDEDIVFVAQYGDFANTSMPHHRSMCGHCSKPFALCTAAEKAAICQQCYCYPCDKPASECLHWEESHCQATPNDPEWQKERERLKHMNPNLLTRIPPGQVLNQLMCVREAVMDQKLSEGKLHTCQRQTLAWAHDIEVNGVNPTSLLAFTQSQIYGGILADEMGMGKSLSIIALIMRRPMFTLIVAPPEIVLQWQSAIKQFSHLRTARLYGQAQAPVTQRVLSDELDVIVIGAGSKIDPQIWSKVKRLVVDEAHKILNRKSDYSSDVMRSIRYDSGLIKYKWILSGTPWVSIGDEIVNRYLKFLTNSGGGIKSDATLDDLRLIVMRHTASQRVRHEDGVFGAALSIPEVQHRQLHVQLTHAEKRLYEIAGCLDNTCELMGQSISRSNLLQFFAHRLMIANGYSKEFGQCLARFFRGSNIPIGHSHEWLNGVHDVYAESIGLLNTLGDDGKVSKFTSILADMKKQLALDAEFKAVIVTDRTDTIGEWMSKWSGMSVLVAETARGKSKARTQHKVNEFQTGRHTVFVCPNAVAEVGVNLQQAKALYFVDPDFDTTRYDQAVGRIRRAGVKHTELHAIMVVVDGTVHEAIHQYHTQIDKNDMRPFTSIVAQEEGAIHRDICIEWDLCPHNHSCAEDRFFGHEPTTWVPQSRIVCTELGSFKVRRLEWRRQPSSDGSLRITDFFDGNGLEEIDYLQSVVDATPVEHEFELIIPTPFDADEIETIVVRTDHGEVRFPTNLGRAVECKDSVTPARTVAENAAPNMTCYKVRLSISAATHGGLFITDNRTAQLIMTGLSVCLKSNPEARGPYRFERTFLSMQVRECETSRRRSIVKSSFIAVCSRSPSSSPHNWPWWLKNARCRIENNTLQAAAHIAAYDITKHSSDYWYGSALTRLPDEIEMLSEDDRLTVYSTTQNLGLPMHARLIQRGWNDIGARPAFSDLNNPAHILAELTEKSIERHRVVPFEQEDAFYEKDCVESYAKICVQLSAPAPIGTPVQFQVFDRVFSLSVRTDVDATGQFTCRIPSEAANGQDRWSRVKLLTEDAWVMHRKVSIRFPTPDPPRVKLRLQYPENLSAYYRRLYQTKIAASDGAMPVTTKDSAADTEEMQADTPSALPPPVRPLLPGGVAEAAKGDEEAAIEGATSLVSSSVTGMGALVGDPDAALAMLAIVAAERP